MRGKILIHNHNYTNLHLTGRLNFFLHFSFKHNGEDAINSCKIRLENSITELTVHDEAFLQDGVPNCKIFVPNFIA